MNSISISYTLKSELSFAVKYIQGIKINLIYVFKS